MNHSHGEKFREEIEGGEFSFHPFLATWFRQAFELVETETVYALEISCDTNDCPIQETILFAKSKNITLKVGRKKNAISKMDFQLALKKQKSIA